ncbi:hypothetical protein GGR58DRAFT_526242 [Xylaria digitata]|nr:hypothetical protein GGR58DRAFT_526242 [Xylaria digitata]
MHSFLSTSRDTSGYKVQLGVWTNWSRGPVWGATLTLNRQQGSLLIAFTAFFVTVVATRFWRVACSILHRKLSVAEPRDALHYQRQAVFRNSTSSQSALWSLMQITWAWRHLAQNNLSRTLPSIVFAIITLLVFSFASGFSSSISTAIGDEVLIDGSDCGILDFGSLSTEEYFRVSAPWASGAIDNAANYAQQVYSPDNTGIFSSTIFVKRELDTTSNLEAPCPFKGGLCRSNSSNLLLDSGYVGTGQKLGVNLPPDQNLLYRQIVQCAPLITEGRKKQTQFLNNTLVGTANYTSYSYGPSNYLSREGNSNFTLIIKDNASQYIPPGSQGSTSGYALTEFRSVTDNGTSLGDFIPEPGLRRPDADIFLFFLSGNGMVSSVPLNDPWYRFDVKSAAVIFKGGSNESLPSYQPSEAASPLGCTYQVQVCKGALARNESCGLLGSPNDAWRDAAHLFGVDTEDYGKYSFDQLIEAYINNQEAGRFLWFSQILWGYPIDISIVVNILGSQSLASRRNVLETIQGPLPDDQWKLDVTYWWNISLSALQAAFVDTAYGPSNPDVFRLQTKPKGSGQKSICENQKILNAQYISVSVFGLYFTYLTGLLVIILSLVMDSLFSCAQKRWKYKEYENLEWISNETLQLQRLAYDESGQAEWSNCTDSIPVTAPGQNLGSFNLNDLEHPRIGRPRSPRPSKEIHPPAFIIHAPDVSSERFGEEHDGEVGEQNSPPVSITHHLRSLTV